MKVAFTDVDQQSVNGRTARAVNRSTGEVHTVTIAGGEADFGQLTYQQAYEVYGVTASGARVTQVLVKTETNEPEPDLEAPTSAPSGLAATVVSTSRIDLSWNALSGATSYEYRIDSGAAVSVGSNTSAQATGLSADTQYGFQVRGRNDAGAGPWSSVVQATTQALPDPNDITQIPGYLFHMSAQSGVYSDIDATVPAGVSDDVLAWVSPQGKKFTHNSDNPPQLRDFEGVREVWAPPQAPSGLMVADGGPSTDQKNAYLCIALRTHNGFTGGISVGTSNTNGNGQRGQLRKGGGSNSKLEIFLDPNVSVVSPDIVSETEHRVVEVVMAEEGAHFEVDGVQVGDASGPYTGGGNPGFGDHLFGLGRVAVAAFWLGNDPALTTAQKDIVRAWVQSQIDTEA